MTAVSAVPAVWTAIYSTLNVAAITSTLGCAVYDDVPQRPTYPYLRLQSPTENRMDTMSKAGKDITLQVFIVTSSDSYHGAHQAQAIASKVHELLNYVALSVTGFDCLMVRPEQLEDIGDYEENGVLYKQYVQHVRVWVMPQ